MRAEIFPKFVRWFAIPGLTLWLAFWIVRSWAGLQDDALIHLRYAEFLYRLHFITYDGVHPSYGTSSLLYVGLLAVLRSFTKSVLVLRVLTVAVHGALFAALAGFVWRASYRASVCFQALAVSLLVVLAAPSAVRWLDEGMETGLVLCFTVTLIAFTHRFAQRPARRSDFIVGAVLGFGIEALRNELGLVAFFCTAVLCVADAERTSDSSPRRSGFLSRALRAVPSRSHFLLGSILAALAIRLIMHHFLPDTALAKSSGIRGFGGTLFEAADIMAGSITFGVGATLLWFVSAAVALSLIPLHRAQTLTANLLFPGLLLLSALRGQQIQGMRYLIWALVFSIVWNLLELRHLTPAQIAQRTLRPWIGLQTRAALTVLVLLLCAMPLEAHWIGRPLKAVATATNTYLAHDLTPVLAGRNGMAGDVGYVGYFTQGSICDLSGLVNGRAVAQLTPSQQVQRCAATHPVFFLTNTPQLKSTLGVLPVQNWSICGIYDHGNLKGPDRHYLLVEPGLARATCAANDFRPLPISVALVEAHYP